MARVVQVGLLLGWSLKLVSINRRYVVPTRDTRHLGQMSTPDPRQSLVAVARHPSESICG